MIWLLFLGLAALALAPLGLSLLRPPRPQGRHQADLALYRAQLAELEREHAAGRLDTAGLAAARTEVQRRLLAAPADSLPTDGTPTDGMPNGSAPPDGTPMSGMSSPRSHGAALLAAMLFLIPASGVGLYLWHGAPDVPAAPFTERAAVAAQEDALLAQLRARIAMAPPGSEGARQGWLLLAGAERARGHLDGAADAWERALAIRFDPGIAAELAELHLQRGENDPAASLLRRALAQQPTDPRLRFLAGLAESRAGRTDAARILWDALLRDSPTDAPWRALLERELQRLPPG